MSSLRRDMGGLKNEQDVSGGLKSQQDVSGGVSPRPALDPPPTTDRRVRGRGRGRVRAPYQTPLLNVPKPLNKPSSIDLCSVAIPRTRTTRRNLGGPIPAPLSPDGICASPHSLLPQLLLLSRLPPQLLPCLHRMEMPKIRNRAQL